MHLGRLADGSLASLVVQFLSEESSLSALDSCISSSYRGTYGDFRLYTPDVACSVPIEKQSQCLSWDEKADELVWVNEVPLADHLYQLRQHTPPISNITGYLDMFGLACPTSNDSTEILQSRGSRECARSGEGFTVLQSTKSSVLLAMPAHKTQDFYCLLPPAWNAYTVPPVAETGSYLPVPQPDVDRVREMLEGLQYSEAVADVVDAISIVQLKSDIRWLSGEEAGSPIVSRHSFAEGSRYAASWMKDVIQGTGAVCELQPFLTGFAPNLLCRYPSTANTTSTVVLGAHYDSRGSFGNPRAPGADDNGSGTIGVLSIARLIASKGLTFKSNVELALFAGEEQGLLGSRHYAKQLREANKNVTFMLQADSVAYRIPGAQSQLGLPDLIGTPEAAQLVGNISNLYSPELYVGYTPVCCSDHQSFHEQGFPATWIYESAGPVIDPMYHNSGDLSDRIGYDFNQVRSAVRVMFATVLHTAGFDLPRLPLTADDTKAQQAFQYETGFADTA